MKKNNLEPSSVVIASMLALPLLLGGCNRTTEPATDSVTTNTDTPAVSTTNNLVPVVENPSGVPVPSASSKSDTNMAPSDASSPTTSPASESSKAATNAAPSSGESAPAPSQNSKNP